MNTGTDYKMFINGKWTEGAQGKRLDVLNPANEQVIGTIIEGCEEDAQAALEAAQKAQPAWAALPAIERGRLISALADKVQQNSSKLAEIVVAEQGKPMNQAIGEIGATENFLRYFAEAARRIEGEMVTSDNTNEDIWIRRVPYGVVVGLTAWNYPSALAARKLAPALVAGNTFVLLAHEVTPFSGLELAKLAQEVGIPDGVFNVVTGYGSVVGQALVDSQLSNLVTLTGSNVAGKQVYRSGAETMKNVRLELGGKAPFIVLEDADIDQAVEAAVGSRFANCGQVCTCNERMYIHEKIYDEFMGKFLEKTSQLTIGDPLTNPDIGPKVNQAEIEKISAIVEAGIEAGAKVLLAGGPLTEGEFEKGFWYAPTVLEVTDNNNPLIQKEIFGPVIPAMKVTSLEQALAFANETDFGLSAYIFSNDMKTIMTAREKLQFAELYINRGNGEQVQGFHSGWGMSGLGGEDGKHGFEGYLHKQTSYVNWG